MGDWTAATAWEVEAERRREVLDADVRWRLDEPTRDASSRDIVTPTRPGVRGWPARLLEAWRTSTGQTVRSGR